MSNNITTCPHCQKPIMKGAMRCVSCGRILQTTEERMATIEKLQKKKKFSLLKLLKYVTIIIILGYLYQSYSGQIIETLKNLFGV